MTTYNGVVFLSMFDVLVKSLIVGLYDPKLEKVKTRGKKCVYHGGMVVIINK